MWFECQCGQQIKDISDGHSYKAHFMSDKNWLLLWDAVDNTIESPATSPKEKETTCMNVRKKIYSRVMYQCFQCGRIYLNDENNQLISFTPEIENTSVHLLDFD